MRNLNLIILAFAFLQTISPILSNEIQGLISQERVRLVDHTLYVRKNITGASSTFDIIDGNTEQTKGISTITGQKTRKNEVVVFSQIALGYGEIAGANNEGAVQYDNTDIAALRNANLVINQNNREVINLPVADLLRPSGTDLNASDQYYKLGGFAFLVDDENFDMQLVFPNGVAMPAPVVAGDNQYLEVMIKGFKTIKNLV